MARLETLGQMWVIIPLPQPSHHGRRFPEIQNICSPPQHNSTWPYFRRGFHRKTYPRTTRSDVTVDASPISRLRAASRARCIICSSRCTTG